MGDQPVTKPDLEGITTTFTTTINALTVHVATLSTQVNINVKNNVNNNTNNNKRNNQNRGRVPIKVPRGGNNRIIADSSSEEEDIVTEEGDGRGNHHDYRVKVDIPLFYGTMRVEEFLDW